MDCEQVIATLRGHESELRVDADCMLYGMTKAEMLKLLPVKRRNVPVQKVQLLRKI
jgi:hypothetical protein